MAETIREENGGPGGASGVAPASPDSPNGRPRNAPYTVGITEESADAASPPPDGGLICLIMLARYFELPAEPAQLAHAMGMTGQVFQADDLLRGAKRLGLKSRLVRKRQAKVGKTPLPAIAGKKSGGFFILAQVGPAADGAGEGDDPDAGGGQVLIQDPLSGRPETISRAELAEIWNGELILLASRAGGILSSRKFNISWFLPALIKYRRLFTEVLIASFFLQLFGLITPLFFQVIIDKVLVHRGLSSLDVLIFAMAVVAIFEVILGALRTYIFSHTTTRVDVELGARLFEHVMRLPIAYFGARRVGDTVARLKELENIRNFITGSALTLVIDLGFTVVFFVVMYYFAPTLTWIVLASIPCYVLLCVIVSPILRARLEEKFRRGAENHAFPLAPMFYAIRWPPAWCRHRVPGRGHPIAGTAAGAGPIGSTRCHCGANLVPAPRPPRGCWRPSPRNHARHRMFGVNYATAAISLPRVSRSG